HRRSAPGASRIRADRELRDDAASLAGKRSERASLASDGSAYCFHHNCQTTRASAALAGRVTGRGDQLRWKIDPKKLAMPPKMLPEGGLGDASGAASGIGGGGQVDGPIGGAGTDARMPPWIEH